MSSTHINRWVDVAHAPGGHWPDVGVSVAVTAVLFVAAFAAMTSLRVIGVTEQPASSERVTWVPVPVPAPVPPRVRTPPEIRPVAPTVANPALRAPDVVAPAIPQAPPIRTPAPTDSSARSGPPPIPLSTTPLKTLPYVPRPTNLAGAPVAPAGVTAIRTPMTARVRDSIMAASMAEVPSLAAVEQSGPVRVNVVPVGSGGQTAVHAGVSLPFPIFEPGPSPEQRRRDAIVAAENQARLNRLQDRAIAKRDSVRLDSLRRDSIAKNTKPPH